MSWVSVLKLGEMGSRKTFDDFDKALETARGLTYSMGNIYLWKETKGQPIKWMKVTK